MILQIPNLDSPCGPGSSGRVELMIDNQLGRDFVRLLEDGEGKFGKAQYQVLFSLVVENENCSFKISALHLAMLYGDPYVLKRILKRVPPKEFLESKIQLQGSGEIPNGIKWLQGATPFHVAAIANEDLLPEIMGFPPKSLLTLNWLNDHGQSPIQLAMAMSLINNVKIMLLTNKIDVLSENMSIDNATTEVAKLLVEKLSPEKLAKNKGLVQRIMDKFPDLSPLVWRKAAYSKQSNVLRFNPSLMSLTHCKGLVDGGQHDLLKNVFVKAKILMAMEKFWAFYYVKAACFSIATFLLVVWAMTMTHSLKLDSRSNRDAFVVALPNEVINSTLQHQGGWLEPLVGYNRLIPFGLLATSLLNLLWQISFEGTHYLKIDRILHNLMDGGTCLTMLLMTIFALAGGEMPPGLMFFFIWLNVCGLMKTSYYAGMMLFTLLECAGISFQILSSVSGLILTLCLAYDHFASQNLMTSIMNIMNMLQGEAPDVNTPVTGAAMMITLAAMILMTMIGAIMVKRHPEDGSVGFHKTVMTDVLGFTYPPFLKWLEPKNSSQDFTLLPLREIDRVDELIIKRAYEGTTSMVAKIFGDVAVLDCHGRPTCYTLPRSLVDLMFNAIE